MHTPTQTVFAVNFHLATPPASSDASQAIAGLAALLRSLALLAIALTAGVLAKAQGPQVPAQEVNSSISEVTVYRQGALVRRSGRVTLSAGTQEVAFVGLEQGVRTGSVQLAVDQQVSTFALEVGLDPSRPAADPDSLRVLRTRLDSIDLAIARVNAQRAGIQEELAVLVANRDLSSEQSATPTSATAVRDAAKLYRELTTNAQVALYELGVRERLLQQTRQQFEQRINNIRPAERTDIGRINATLLADRAGTYDVELSYVVENASWTPDYDLFVNSEGGKPARLLLTANVQQSTGVDWRDVRLTLSSSDINSRLSAPYLSSVVLGSQAVDLSANYAGAVRQKSRAESDAYPAAAPMQEVQLSYAPATFAYESNSAAARLYTIDRPFSLAANGRMAAVKLTSNNLPVQLRYHVVPKRELLAYLEGVVTGWDTLNLLGATMRLHLDDRFLGTSYLDASQDSDTLTVGLGPDPRLVVERVGRGQGSDTKVLRGRKTYDLGYRIALRNTRAQAIDVVVEDQIPISSREEITVELKEATGKPSHDPATGKLTWRLSLKPATREQFDVRYLIDAPKEVPIQFE